MEYFRLLCPGIIFHLLEVSKIMSNITTATVCLHDTYIFKSTEKFHRKLDTCNNHGTDKYTVISNVSLAVICYKQLHSN